MESPLISVVVPVLDAGSYLDSCVRSLRDQTHRNLQIICVDDGSQDGSTERLSLVARRDSRIELLSSSRGGPGGARNLGIDRAEGEYLMFVDADDVAVPQAVELLLRSVEQTGSDFAVGRVERLSGRVSWPSRMHERALAHPRRRTHISHDWSLLYDSTSWNKLFRATFWRDNGLRFPPGILFEDVPLMVEAHCRASSVDVIEDVVYRWRLREDGVLSITQRRDDVLVLDQRVESMRRVRELLRRFAMLDLGRAAETKFLRNDLGCYLKSLPATSDRFQRRFFELARDFSSLSPEAALTRLNPTQRTAYHLIRSGTLDQLTEFLRYSARLGDVLPLRRRGLSVHADVGPAASRTPAAVTDLHGRVPLRMGIDAVRWSDRHLELDGYAFLRGLPYAHPAAAVRRLKIVQRSSGRTTYHWLAPTRHPEASARHGQRHSYGWSGFRARVPLSVFDLPAEVGLEGWDIYLQALGPGVAGGSSVGPPRTGGAWFPGTARRSSGVSLSATWTTPTRLVINARRFRHTVVDVEHAEGRLSCRMVALRDETSHPTRLDLVGSTVEDESTPVLVEWACRPDHRGCLGAAVIDTGPLTQGLGDRQDVACRLSEATAEGPLPIGTSLEREACFRVGDLALLVRDDGSGGVELLATPPRVSADSTAWADGRLRVEGWCSLAGPTLPGLAFRHGSGETVEATEVRSGDRFTSVFDLRCIAGPEGPRRLPAGRWQLVRPLNQLDWVPVRASHGRQGAIEGTTTPHELMVDLKVNRHSEIGMQVSANAEHARGAAAQVRLRQRVYAPARRAGPLDQILVECWGGKQYADNPRALVESLRDAGIELPVAVVVSDRSIVVPGRAQAVVRWSREYWELLGRARLIIANDLLTQHYRKGPDQLLLQTWHGTPLKRLGFDIERIHLRHRSYLDDLRSEAATWDWLVSPNPHSTAIMPHAFGFDGPVLETGYPRNDLLAGADVAERDRRRARARRWFGADAGTTVALWMPTFRDDAHLPGGGYGAPVAIDIEALRAGLPAGTVLWLRGHHLMDRAFARLGDRDRRLRIASSYPDLRDLLLAADVLITDYSSVMFDFALTDKPMIFFVPDLERYRDTVRGFYFDPFADAPGPVVRTAQDLIGAIEDRTHSSAAFLERRAAFRRRFGLWEDGHAARRVWDVVSRAL